MKYVFFGKEDVITLKPDRYNAPYGASGLVYEINRSVWSKWIPFETRELSIELKEKKSIVLAGETLYIYRIAYDVDTDQFNCYTDKKLGEKLSQNSHTEESAQAILDQWKQEDDKPFWKKIFS